MKRYNLCIDVTGIEIERSWKRKREQRTIVFLIHKCVLHCNIGPIYRKTYGPMIWAKTMDIHLQLFITLPLGCPSRICLIKTLLEKNPLGKNPSKGKRVRYPLCLNCLIKNLTRKTQWDKTMVKEKRVQNIFMSPPHKDNMR